MSQDGETNRQLRDQLAELLASGLLHTLHSGACGRVWQKDELAYKCRTCELDPTCAICVDCFRAGNHQDHDFAIIRTGGGCCDCGDGQAWKKSGFCSKHGGASTEHEDPAATMDPAHRVRLADAVSRAADVVAQFASDLVAQPKQRVPERQSEDVLWYLDMLLKLVRTGDAVNRVAALALVSPTASAGSNSWLEKMQFCEASGTGFTLAFTNDLHALYYHLITDHVFKSMFLRLFARNYCIFIDAMANKRNSLVFYRATDGPMAFRTPDDGRGDILDNFSVQLFTVPVLVPVMINEELLENMICSLLDVLQLVSTGAPPTIDFEIRMQIYHPVLWRVIFDFRYVLTHNHMAAHLILERQDLFSLFMDAVSFLQGMGPITRLRQPPEFDSDTWATPFTWELEFYQLFELLREGFDRGTKDNDISSLATRNQRIKAIYIVQKKLFDWISCDLNRPDKENEGNMPLDSRTGMVPAVVSVHLPLHRFFAFLVHSQVSAYQTPIEKLFTEPDTLVPLHPAHAGRLLGVHVFRCQHFLSEVDAGLWRRNGSPTLSAAVIYRSSYCAEWFVDHDVFALQIATGLMSCDKATFGPTLTKMVGCFHGSTHNQITPNLIEYVLRLAVAIVSDRSNYGLSKIDSLRRGLIHRLCLDDHTHSGLMKFLPRLNAMNDAGDYRGERTHLNSIINSIAKFTRARDMEQGKFTLRPDCWNEFDPFNVHYSTRERSAAEHRFEEYLKSENREIAFFPLYRVSSLHSLPGLAPLTPLVHLCCASNSCVGISLSNLVVRLSESESSLLTSAGGLGFLVPALFLVKIALEDPQMEELTGHLSRELVTNENWRKSPVQPLTSILALTQKEHRERLKDYLGSMKTVLELAADKNAAMKDTLASHGFPFSEVEEENEQTRRKARLAEAKKQQRAAMESMHQRQMSFLQSAAGQDNAEEENPNLASLPTETCAICGKEETSMEEIGMIGFSQKSRLLYHSARGTREKSPDESTGTDSRQEESTSGMGSPATPPDPTNPMGFADTDWPHFLDMATLKAGFGAGTSVHVGFCGHYVHKTCFGDYFSSLLLRQMRRLSYEGDHLARIENGEFFCPMCRRLSNVVLPLFKESEAETAIKIEDREKKDFDAWEKEVMPKFCPYDLKAVLNDERIRGNCPVGEKDERELGHVSGFPRLGESLAITPRPLVSFPQLTWNDLRKQVRWLWSAALTTICDLEQLSRLSGPLDPHLLRCTSKLVHSARAHGSPRFTGVGMRLTTFHFLWSQVWSSEKPEFALDPFAAFFLMVMAFPEKLRACDIDNICRICFGSVVLGLRECTPIPELLQIVRYLVVFLRRASIAKSCLLAKETVELFNDSCEISEFTSLCETFGLEVDLATIGLSTDGSAVLSKYLRKLLNSTNYVPQTSCRLGDIRSVVRWEAPQLIALPRLFQRLLENHENTPCFECGRPPHLGLLCLVCGKILCGRGKCKGQEPEYEMAEEYQAGGGGEAPRAATHGAKCGAGIGIFLVLKQTIILLERDGRQGLWGSPYLDEHEEEDFGLRRGKPLWLSNARYALLNRLWVSHGLDGNTQILNQSIQMRGH